MKKFFDFTPHLISYHCMLNFFATFFLRSLSDKLDLVRNLDLFIINDSFVYSVMSIENASQLRSCQVTGEIGLILEYHHFDNIYRHYDIRFHDF